VHAAIGNLLADGVYELERVELEHGLPASGIGRRLDLNTSVSATPNRAGPHHHPRRVPGQPLEPRMFAGCDVLR